MGKKYVSLSAPFIPGSATQQAQVTCPWPCLAAVGLGGITTCTTVSNCPLPLASSHLSWPQRDLTTPAVYLHACPSRQFVALKAITPY